MHSSCDNVYNTAVMKITESWQESMYTYNKTSTAFKNGWVATAHFTVGCLVTCRAHFFESPENVSSLWSHFQLSVSQKQSTVQAWNFALRENFFIIRMCEKIGSGNLRFEIFVMAFRVQNFSVPLRNGSLTFKWKRDFAGFVFVLIETSVFHKKAKLPLFQSEAQWNPDEMNFHLHNKGQETEANGNSNKGGLLCQCRLDSMKSNEVCTRQNKVNSSLTSIMPYVVLTSLSVSRVKRVQFNLLMGHCQWLTTIKLSIE